MRDLRSAAAAFTLAFTLIALSAQAEVVSYQKGDGKGSVSETDDTTGKISVPDTTWIDDGNDVMIFEIDSDTERHSFLRFPNIFGDGANQIPSGSLILSATLTVYLDNEGTDCGDVFQLNEGWTELEATWNSRRTGVPWSDPGADGPTSHKAVAEGTLPCNLPLGSKNVDVITSVQNWSNGDLNEGWVLVDNGPSSNGANYRSSEHTTLADRPQLTVSFLPSVFYSVGTDTSDLKTGSPTITIASGVATLSVAQTNDTGVGDVIDYDIGNDLVYIAGVISPTQFRVQNADGTAATPGGPFTVNTIQRAFNSISSAVTGSVDANHLNNNDLTSIGRKLTWVCYKDGVLNESAIINGYTTDATRFITLTVAGASQVATGVSQRHLGVAGTGTIVGPTGGNGIDPRESYTVIEWLEIDGSAMVAGTPYGINSDTTGDNSTFQNLLVHNFNQTVNGACLYFETSGNQIRNTIAYSCGRGVRFKFGVNNTLANSTLHDILEVGVLSTNTSTGNVIENVISAGSLIFDFEEQSGADFLVFNNNISSDLSAGSYGGAANQTGIAPVDLFVSLTGPVNLHLRAGAIAIDAGKDLSTNFIDDIDDEARPIAALWDVGADESVFSSAVTNYRSIGSAANLVNQGTATVTVGSTTVTKTGGAGWLAQNRGRGDVLIVGADEYMILRVVSDNELRLVSLPVTGYVGSTYTIARQHTTLQSWYDCVNNTSVCPYFPVSSASLVADDRGEVGIAYKDTPFVLSGDINMQGATTDTSHTIRLTADPGNRHNGTPLQGVVVDANGANELGIRDSNITLEWLEFVGCKGADALSAIEVWGTDGDTAVNTLLQNLLIHDFDDLTVGYNNSGIDLTGDNTLIGKNVIIRNTMLWDGDQRGIEGDEPLDTAIIENVSIDGMTEDGIWSDASSFTIRNTVVTSSPSQDYDAGSGSITGSDNTSSDPSAAVYFTTFQTFVSAASVYVTPNANLHLKVGVNPAVDAGLDLSGSFVNDIDDQYRPLAAPWDIGADERDATTAVSLASFAATSSNGAVELSWETASELNNLGFHLYRARAAAGAYERITDWPIPGLGSSPVGARYSHRDTGLENGVTYYYKLEDIETTGASALHGPVSATPEPSAPNAHSPSTSSSRIVYGDPTANALTILKQNRRELILELTTEGFYAEPQDDGSVNLEVPGFDSLNELTGPDMPVKRTWVEAIAGRKVRLVSVQPRNVDAFTGLRPSSDAELPDIVATLEGTVRASRHRARKSFRGKGLSPSSAARIVSVGFQGELKKALVELAPLRWDETQGQLLLARRLIVRLSFREPEPSELLTGRGYKKALSHDRRNVVAHLRTTEKGLHGVRYEDVLRGRRGVRANELRLTRQGVAVAYHLTPSSNRFKPGSVLYFVGEGSQANPYGSETVYELEVGATSEAMLSVSSTPEGAPVAVYSHRQEWEQNRYYQSALVDAPDLWLWDLLFAPETKSFPLEVSALVSSGAPAKLDVWLQGASDFVADPDHHVRVYVNGSFATEASWDGKQTQHLEVALAPGLLRDGDNVLELENVGDTEAAYSMVLLDRYALTYERFARASDGRLEGQWSGSGTAELAGLGAGAHVLDVTGAHPLWLTDAVLGDDATLRFRAESGHRYLAVSPDAVHRPRVTTPAPSLLKNARNRADYLVIGPETFLRAAAPLLELRQSQGLRVKAISIEEIYSQFGFGESTPEAIRDFLSYAFHNWKQPSPRYVLLVGDGTYDYKDALQTGVTNQVPPRIVRTSYLWTASDPSYAAVNGDDILPDLAIGRLPAATVEQVQAMVQKIVTYETADIESRRGSVVLVADNSDAAGDFEADANALAAGVLASSNPSKIYLSQLGTAATRSAIRQSFDDGASLVSYLGHGGIRLWADENVFNAGDVTSFDAQPQQPLLLTMNCLNGFFHFPYFNSLAEELVQAPDKGAIAAFSPSGLSLNGPASVYHQALVEELVLGGHHRLGDALLRAQQVYAETGAFPELLSIYHLFGDPALVLR